MKGVPLDIPGVKCCIIPRASRFIRVFISFRLPCPAFPRSGVTDARDHRFESLPGSSPPHSFFLVSTEITGGFVA